MAHFGLGVVDVEEGAATRVVDVEFWTAVDVAVVGDSVVLLVCANTSMSTSDARITPAAGHNQHGSLVETKERSKLARHGDEPTTRNRKTARDSMAVDENGS